MVQTVSRPSVLAGIASVARRGGSAGAALRPEARGARLHVRRCGSRAAHRAGHAHRDVDRGLLRRRRHAARPAAVEGRADRPRQSRRRGRSTSTAPSRATRSSIRIEKLEPARVLRDLVVLSGVRRAERDRPHRDAPARSARRRSGSTTSTGAKGVARTHSTDGKRTWEVPLAPVSRLPRRGAGQRRGALDDRSRQLRRQHGLPGGARRQHRLPRRPRARAASSPSATATSRWATARSSARRSRAR